MARLLAVGDVQVEMNDGAEKLLSHPAGRWSPARQEYPTAPCQTGRMRPRRVTLQHVARRAGVSRTTASFVLTGRHAVMRISDDAQRRVLNAAQELDYRPNRISRGLRTNVTHTIGLVSDTIATEPFAGEVIRGAVTAALANDRMLFVVETEGDVHAEDQLIRDMLDRQVDGFVYATMFTREIHIPDRLTGQPLVLLNCAAGDVRVPAVIPDEVNAGRDAAQVLLDAGHREGIYIVGEPAPHLFAGRERVAGIDAALMAAGVRRAGILDCEWWPAPAHAAVQEFLHSGRRPRAFICLNDRIALGAYEALTEAGIRLPDDLSVVSFDDSFLAGWLRPALTSIALPHADMGKLAVELLINGDGAGEHRVAMPVHRRESVTGNC
jgi:LacI family transcriptional regulator, galactose operon repressor